MGKGDKKSKRGKITIGSYGVRRPKKKKVTAKSATKKSAAKTKTDAATKKTAAKKKATKKE